MFPKDISVRVYRYPPSFPLEFAKALLDLVLPIPGYLLVATTEPQHAGDEHWYYFLNNDIREVLEKQFRNDASRYYGYLPLGQMTIIPIDCCDIEITPRPPTTEETDQ